MSEPMFATGDGATPGERLVLDEYNALMKALRMIEVGERISGTSGADAKAKLWRRAHEIERQARERRR